MASKKTTNGTLKSEIYALRAKLNELKAESANEAHKTALDHAWDHFSYHAGQRLVTFRFYLIVVAIFIGAYVKLMSGGAAEISSMVAILGIVFSYVFLRLDLRNKDLIELSEAVLKKEEERLKQKVNYDEIEIMKISDSTECKRYLFPSSYGQALKFLYNFMIVLFLASAVVPLYSPDIMSLFRAKESQQSQGASGGSGSQTVDQTDQATQPKKGKQAQGKKKPGN